MRSILLGFLAFYQKFLTLFSYGSCRYYPSCSEYAKLQFQKNNLFLAFIHSLLRILRCNQLFKGGIDYPVVHCSQKSTLYKKIDVKFWLIPKSKQKCYIIKKI